MVQLLTRNEIYFIKPDLTLVELFGLKKDQKHIQNPAKQLKWVLLQKLFTAFCH